MLKGLAIARRKCGMSQREFGHFLGVNKMTVSRWERGQHMPRSNRLEEIAKALNCSINFLFTGIEEGEPE